ncbi:MAG: ATP-dependent ligase [Glaciihabitans sp.]|nr:ATP-dependent ligase [Glaciihabitans sp.]
MGTLYYDGQEFDFEDRTLTHLQIVISTKLRRKEDFFLSWSQPVERGSGRHALWIDNGVPIHFFYEGSRAATVNREWIELLTMSAGKALGLQLTEVPEPRTTPPTR